ncbi:hypothetical protein J5N97_003595 [Dioscorea zingiberensis]|uniref:Uncharacterized protein n=1 Tax=Dioscorea zingiberensis TaxID=325984 RepID=A0A9D5D645_9LILI|nr:hypothetical protein J5N97_003595 [Dioscorea zingiberensis]
MTSIKLFTTLLLILSGMTMFQENKSGCMGVIACPQYCLDVAYMTCTSSANQHLPGKCNCCLAPKGCILHLNDGSQVNCTT